jgi:hypothetical protein
MRTVPATVIIVTLCALPAGAGTKQGSTWVMTFDHDFYNWATPHEQTFVFPPLSESYSQVLLHYTIECPTAPGDCDPWDRIGYLKVLHEELDETVTEYEIARIITPYDITGGSYPGSCSWVLDVSDYRSLLHDEVTLSNYIETWIGGERGWIVTIEFEFVPGTPDYEVHSIVNLWSGYHMVFGDPDNPIDANLQPQDLGIAADVVAGKIRAVTTGHGQGNTDNAAEFSRKWHEVSIDGVATSHRLFRTDCPQNPCSPQGGTWQYNRAGWCPGDKVDPWDVDVTARLQGGVSSTFDYEVEPYENLCRPNNPTCVSGVTCPDCNYNSTGHTQPHYALVGQLILYSRSPHLFVDDFESGNTTAWAQATP